MTLVADPVRLDGLDAGHVSIDALVGCKADTVVSTCIPARDEAATIAGVVAAAAALRAVGLIDEILVIDDGSTDATHARASAAGARVLPNPDGPGKGQALRHAVANAPGDLLVFLDADVTSYTASFLARLMAPLLLDPGVQRTGARSTGESAVRRAALDHVSLSEGYGIEIALLIDVYLAHGIDAIAEVDLGERIHRNRPLDQLRPHARDVLDAVLARTSLTSLPGELR